MAGTITVGELLSDPTSNNKITIGSGTTLDLVNGAGSVTGAGKVLQVIEGRDTTDITASIGTEATVITLNITPSSSSSKILVSYSVDLLVVDNRGTAYTDYGYARVVRDGSTQVCKSYINSYAAGNAQGRGISGGTYLDEPSTSSPITYTVMISGSEALYDYATAKGTATPSVLVLMEIGA